MFTNRFRRPRLLPPAALPAALLAFGLVAEAAAQDDLSRGDRRWMEEVEPIMTARERQLFQQIDRDDRDLFRELFWARRDPSPANRTNEASEAFEQWREQADERFGRRGQKGSETDMAKIMLLLGPPDNREQQRRAGGPPSAQPPEGATGQNPAAQGGGGPGGPPGGGGGGGPGGRGGGGGGGFKLIYVPNPDAGLPDGLEIEFRSTNLGPRMIRTDEIDEALERARQRQVVWPSINYALDETGRLRELDDIFDPNSPAKVILAALREGGPVSTDIPVEADFSFFRSNNYETYVAAFMHVGGDGFSWRDGKAEAQAFYSVTDAVGTVIGQAEEDVELVRAEDGSAMLEMPMQMPPGTYTVYIGVRDPATEAHGEAMASLESPDFNQEKLMVSTMARFSDGERIEDFTPVPGRALLVGGFHFTPRVSRVYAPGDEFRVVFNAYGYGAEGGQPSLTWQIRFNRDGSPVLQYNPTDFNLASEELSIAIVDVPLARLFADGRREPFEAGSYTAEIIVNDQVGGGTVTEVIEFEIEGSGS